MYYSGSWQIVEERIYDGWSSGSPGSVDRIAQHVWGLRYIDDIVLDRQDSGANGSYENTWYHLTDHQFSTVALIDSSSHLVERVEYTPYGEARHHWALDVNGDGDVDSGDDGNVDTAYSYYIYQSNYNPDADFDRSSQVDRGDQSALTSSQYAGSLPAGQISAGSVGNSIGYCGYVFNGEAGSGGLYTVRFRHYDPPCGRWLERDPAGYVDGMSLYEYVGGGAITFLDPSGLFWGEVWEFAKYATVSFAIGVVAVALVPEIILAVVAIPLAYAAGLGIYEVLTGEEVDWFGQSTGRRLTSYERSGLAGSIVGGFAAAAVGGAKVMRGRYRGPGSGQRFGVSRGAGKVVPRPRGVPKDWPATPSKKGGGTKWADPENPHHSVREMPGNPDSPNPAQQQPYIKRMYNGKAVDKNGNLVDPNCPDAHIPVPEWPGMIPPKDGS